MGRKLYFSFNDIQGQIQLNDTFLFQNGVAYAWKISPPNNKILMRSHALIEFSGLSSNLIGIAVFHTQAGSRKWSHLCSSKGHNTVELSVKLAELELLISENQQSKDRSLLPYTAKTLQKYNTKKAFFTDKNICKNNVCQCSNLFFYQEGIICVLSLLPKHKIS